MYADQPAGSETLVTVVCGKDELLVKQIGIQLYEINQPVQLTVNPDKINVYATDSQMLVKKSVYPPQTAGFRLKCR